MPIRSARTISSDTIPISPIFLTSAPSPFRTACSKLAFPWEQPCWVLLGPTSASPVSRGCLKEADLNWAAEPLESFFSYLASPPPFGQRVAFFINRRQNDGAEHILFVVRGALR